ncbi:tRNA (pseudouridine(54)-N(1))-methyltransferase [Clarias magur]|uniref:tRNA (Pseudouridine(54)-N(1))-methyltransferase n=1 Tax=Clarias magur TaxID=1594786 RepID=A0A8J4U3P5_CLAMG|nr:tRNA (pseudouridine(54)-N(1))-methyltransferase [Clarias magur]
MVQEGNRENCFSHPLKRDTSVKLSFLVKPERGKARGRCGSRAWLSSSCRGKGCVLNQL